MGIFNSVVGIDAAPSATKAEINAVHARMTNDQVTTIYVNADILFSKNELQLISIIPDPVPEFLKVLATGRRPIFYEVTV